MILLALFFLAVAVLAAVALHRDLRAADRRRRIRAIVASAPMVTIRADYSKFSAAMGRAMLPAVQRAAVSAAEATAAFARLRTMLDELPRCRWCTILARVGLSHHAAHYTPRHRAATR